MVPWAFLVLLKADCTFLPQYSLPPPCFLLLLIRAQRVYAMRLSEKAMLSETGICFLNAGPQVAAGSVTQHRWQSLASAVMIYPGARESHM